MGDAQKIRFSVEAFKWTGIFDQYDEKLLGTLERSINCDRRQRHKGGGPYLNKQTADIKRWPGNALSRVQAV